MSSRLANDASADVWNCARTFAQSHLRLARSRRAVELSRGRPLGRANAQSCDVKIWRADAKRSHVQGDTKETLRLFGDSHAVGVVRAALFNAAIAWSALELDEYGWGAPGANNG